MNRKWFAVIIIYLLVSMLVLSGCTDWSNYGPHASMVIPSGRLPSSAPSIAPAPPLQSDEEGAEPSKAPSGMLPSKAGEDDGN